MCTPLTTCVTLCVVACTCAPGVATGWPWEMISVSPSSANSMPSVVTNELMPTTATKNPLISPTAMHAISATITLGTSGRPTRVSIL